MTGVNNKQNVQIKRLANSQPNQFVADCALYGFSIGSDWEPAWANNGTFYHHEHSYYEAGKINHKTTVEEVMLRNVYSSNVYAFVYRVGVSPVQCRDWGFLGINSNSDDWYFRSLETLCYLRGNETLGLFTPTNSISSGSTTLSIGTNIGSGGVDGTLGCSISYNWSELSIVSSSSLALNKYETLYHDNETSNYTAHDSFYYGMFTFSCSSMPWIDISHRVTYYGKSWYGATNDVCFASFSNTY